jgi:hypothetical protein
MRLFKNTSIYIYTSVVSTRAFYTTLNWMSHSLEVSIHQHGRMSVCLSIVLVIYQIVLFRPAPAPFCPPQIPLDQTRAPTRAAVVGSQRLTA